MCEGGTWDKRRVPASAENPCEELRDSGIQDVGGGWRSLSRSDTPLQNYSPKYTTSFLTPSTSDETLLYGHILNSSY